MTFRLEWCDCRWCADDHPGGMVLMVTLPSGDLVRSQQVENMRRHTYGSLLTPDFFRPIEVEDVLVDRIPWSCDNSSFVEFNEKKFREMLECLAHRDHCHFVAAPDVVWNQYEDPADYHLSAIATIEKLETWSPYIRDLGLPVAMVGQDGLENYEIPWELMDAYFIGGSDLWKTSAESESIARDAHSRGMWVHAGRVSSDARIRWCHSTGVIASFDSSAFGRFRGKQDKRDGLQRLTGGLISAGAPANDRLFVTDMEGGHA